MTYTDDTAVKDLKNDDGKACTWLYNKYLQQLRLYAEKIVEDMVSAEDIVHDLFEKLWENREKIDITTSLKSYLYRGVYNNCLSHIKHIKIVRNHIEYTLTMEDSDNWMHTTDNDNPLSILISKEIENEIGKAIEALPARCREVFLLWEEGFSYEEIAKELHTSIGTVHTQIKRAKAKLLKAFERFSE